MADEENKMEAPQQSAADGASEKGSGERVRKRVKVKQGRGDRKSSGSGRSSRGKKSKGSSGITYSIAQGSPISGGYRLWLTGFLIVTGVLVMAYLVLSRLGGPPPLPSD